MPEQLPYFAIALFAVGWKCEHDTRPLTVGGNMSGLAARINGSECYRKAANLTTAFAGGNDPRLDFNRGAVLTIPTRIEVHVLTFQQFLGTAADALDIETDAKLAAQVMEQVPLEVPVHLDSPLLIGANNARWRRAAHFKEGRLNPARQFTDIGRNLKLTFA